MFHGPALLQTMQPHLTSNPPFPFLNHNWNLLSQPILLLWKNTQPLSRGRSSQHDRETKKWTRQSGLLAQNFGDYNSFFIGGKHLTDAISIWRRHHKKVKALTKKQRAQSQRNNARVLLKTSRGLLCIREHLIAEILPVHFNAQNVRYWTQSPAIKVSCDTHALCDPFKVADCVIFLRWQTGNPCLEAYPKLFQTFI